MDKTIAEQKAIVLIRSHCPEYTFQWSYGKHVFGWCRNGQKVIALSLPLTLVNDEKQVTDTLLHEIAHALAGSGHGHDALWKEKCLQVGARPERCYRAKDVILPESKYYWHCQTCGYTRNVFRKPKLRRACRHCIDVYGKGVFAVKFELQLKQRSKIHVIGE